jgi:hypothetical protein
MISTTFENIIKNELRLHYDLNLSGIVEVASQLPFYKDFRLRCKADGCLYLLRLRINFRDDNNQKNQSFSIFIEAVNNGNNFWNNVWKKVYPSTIEKSLTEVRKEIFFVDERFGYMLGHDKISLMSGTYSDSDSDSGLVIETLLSMVETESYISYYQPARSIGSAYSFCAIKIKDDKLYIRPIKGYETETAFDIPIPLDNTGVDIFKAQLFKCLLIYINSEQYNEADYLNLNYEDIKKYFLVLEMKEI